MLGHRYSLALSVVAIASVSIAVGLSPQRKVAPKPAKKVSFATIAPIMKSCSMCHQGAKPKHGLDLTSYANLMKGDKEGKVVVAGNPAQSRLSKAVHRKGAALMPPMAPLPVADVAKIDAWIKAGAKS
jgi:hypothetical protein